MTNRHPPQNDSASDTLDIIRRIQARYCPPEGLTDPEAAWLAGYEAGYICGAQIRAADLIGPRQVHRGD